MRNHRILTRIIACILMFLFAMSGIAASGDIAYAKVEDLKIGDTIEFGSYEQAGKDSFSKSPIEWTVLDIQNGKALVISKYAIDCKRYNTENTETNWEKCSLRQWLNDSFLNYAFTEEEQGIILSSEVNTAKNPNNSVNPGNTTQNKIFILDFAETEKYFPDDETRICFVTEYGVAQGAYSGKSGRCRWWLRTPGRGATNAPESFTLSLDQLIVGSNGTIQLDPGLFADTEKNEKGSTNSIVIESSGKIEYAGYAVDNAYIAVRPAMWISTQKETR